MPPKRCPRYLKRLIADDPDSLRQILRAFQDRRQNKGAETLAMPSMSRVTINLTDLTVTVRTELELALAEISPLSIIDLIHECPVCKTLFWAGRADKVACNKHVERWRKRENRRNQKGKEAEVKTERAAAKLEKTIRGLSKTATALIIAIMARHCRLFHKIDQEASYEIDEISWERVPSSYIVRQTLTMLVKRGYLEHRPSGNPFEDRYEPEDKLFELWAAMPDD
jgi:hypothetical protein